MSYMCVRIFVCMYVCVLGGGGVRSVGGILGVLQKGAGRICLLRFQNIPFG